jgi:hypothetical protein
MNKIRTVSSYSTLCFEVLKYLRRVAMDEYIRAVGYLHVTRAVCARVWCVGMLGKEIHIMQDEAVWLRQISNNVVTCDCKDDICSHH